MAEVLGHKSDDPLVLLLVVQHDRKPGRESEETTSEPYQKAELSTEEFGPNEPGCKSSHSKKKPEVKTEQIDGDEAVDVDLYWEPWNRVFSEERMKRGIDVLADAFAELNP